MRCRKTKSIFVVFATAIVISLAFIGPVTAKESGQTELITSNSLSGKSILPSREGKRRLLESVNKVFLNLKERWNKYEKLLVNKIGKEKTEKIKGLLDELQEILTEIDNNGMEVTSVKEKLTQILYQLRNIYGESSPTGKTKTLSSKNIEVVEIPMVKSKAQTLAKESDNISALDLLLTAIAVIASVITICTWPVSGLPWAIYGAIFMLEGALVGAGVYELIYKHPPFLPLLIIVTIVSVIVGIVAGYFGAPLWSALFVLYPHLFWSILSFSKTS